MLPFPSPADLIRVERAGAHAVHESLLAPEARFAYPTTDLAVARLLEALEGGAAIVRAVNGRWYFPDPHPLNASVSTIVREAIRTGLVVHHRTDVLIPAPVHFRDGDRSLCRVPGEGMGPKRVRLLADPAHVNCRACIDRL